MGYRDYFYTGREIGNLREHHFLRVPQTATLVDGIPDLLGAISEKRVGGFTGGGWPKPSRMGSAAQLIGALEKRRHEVTNRFGTPSDAPFFASTSLANQQTKVARQHRLDIGANASIPGVPAAMTCGVQMEWIKTMTMSWGEGTALHYIPVGFLDALHNLVDADHRQLVPSGALRKHFIISSVLVSRSYSVQIDSEEEFEGDIKARATEIENLNIGVGYDFSVDKQLTVTISGDQPFIIALDAVKWRDLDRRI